MIKYLKITLKRDVFFLFAAILVYLTGALITRFQTRMFDVVNLALGMIVFVIGYALRCLMEYLTESKINPYSRISFDRQDKKYQLVILTIALFVSVFLVGYLILRRNMLIGVNLIYIMLILFLFLLPGSRLGKLLQMNFSLIIEALIVSPLMLLLGRGMQSQNPTSEDFFIALALFFLFVASSIAYQFPEFGKDVKVRGRGFLELVGWETGIKLHNAMILVSYLTFIAFMVTRNTFSVYWPALFTTFVSIFEIYLLTRVIAGMKPNWGMLRATAFLQFFSIVYFLVFPVL